MTNAEEVTTTIAAATVAADRATAKENRATGPATIAAVNATRVTGAVATAADNQTTGAPADSLAVGLEAMVAVNPANGAGRRVIEAVNNGVIGAAVTVAASHAIGTRVVVGATIAVVRTRASVAGGIGRRTKSRHGSVMKKPNAGAAWTHGANIAGVVQKTTGDPMTGSKKTSTIV